MTKREKLLKANPQLKGKEINRRITAEHPDGDEIAILRKAVHALVTGQPVSQEFIDYYDYAEARKAEVKAIIQQN